MPPTHCPPLHHPMTCAKALGVRHGPDGQPFDPRFDRSIDPLKAIQVLIRAVPHADWSAEIMTARAAATVAVCAHPAELWSEEDERRMDIIGQNGELCDSLPVGLSWDTAPIWAMGLVSTSVDDYGMRQLVWVPAVVGDVYGMNAQDFRHMKRGSGQSCSLGHDRSQWVIVATRPPGAAVDRTVK